jgi:hypothetical protein
MQAAHGAMRRVQSESMPVNQWEYNEDVRRRCGPDVPPIPAWLRALARNAQARPSPPLLTAASALWPPGSWGAAEQRFALSLHARLSNDARRLQHVQTLPGCHLAALPAVHRAPRAPELSWPRLGRWR